MYLDLDIRKCVVCAACTVACMDQHDTDLKAGEMPLRAMYQFESQSADGAWHVTYLSASCMHCDECTAAAACRAGCFARDEQTGLMQLDSAQCLRCGACVKACPFHAVVRYADGRAHKCDGCMARVRAGMEPACVRSCPTGALQWRGEPLAAEHSLRAQPQLMEKAERWE